MLVSADEGINHAGLITWLHKQQPSNQDSNKMLEWVRNQLETRKNELKNIPRREDDGGPIVEVHVSAIGLPSHQTISGNGVHA
jgi:hypothetical protein